MLGWSRIGVGEVEAANVVRVWCVVDVGALWGGTRGASALWRSDCGVRQSSVVHGAEEMIAPTGTSSCIRFSITALPTL